MSASTAKAPLSLPAVIDLGRRIAALSSEYERQDQAALNARGNGPTCLAAHNAMEILEEQRRVLRELVATTPARSIADAAVQMAEAFSIADLLEAAVHPTDEVERMAAALVWLTLSALPVIAAAAGLNPVAMHWGQEVGTLYASRFAGLEGVA